jgi:hypothetical protein
VNTFESGEGALMNDACRYTVAVLFALSCGCADGAVEGSSEEPAVGLSSNAITSPEVSLTSPDATGTSKGKIITDVIYYLTLYGASVDPDGAVEPEAMRLYVYNRSNYRLFVYGLMVLNCSGGEYHRSVNYTLEPANSVPDDALWPSFNFDVECPAGEHFNHPNLLPGSELQVSSF